MKKVLLKYLIAIIVGIIIGGSCSKNAKTNAKIEFSSIMANEMKAISMDDKGKIWLMSLKICTSDTVYVKREIVKNENAENLSWVNFTEGSIVDLDECIKNNIKGLMYNPIKQKGNDDKSIWLIPFGNEVAFKGGTTYSWCTCENNGTNGTGYCNANYNANSNTVSCSSYYNCTGACKMHVSTNCMGCERVSNISNLKVPTYYVLYAKNVIVLN
jgi:hypothetical protein